MKINMLFNMVKSQFIMYSSQNKRSIFKLSGNMALGNTYTPRVPDPPTTFTAQELMAAKNSLRLLKSKQNQKQASYSTQEYQRPYNNNNYNNKYSGYESYQKPYDNTYEQKNTKKNNIDNQFMDLTYESKGSGKAVYQNIKTKEPAYSSYSRKQPQKAAIPEPKRKQNASQNKYANYSQQKPKQKSLLPSRTRQLQQHKIVNEFEQKPIDQLKTSNKQIPNQYEDDNVELVQCKAGCGRSFKPSVLRTHQKICKKVFQSKRKQFNTQDQRLVEDGQKKLIKKGQIISKKVQQQKSKGTQKMAKWKAQSLAFRQIIKGNNKPKNAQQQQQYKQLQSALKQASGYIKCPTCGRSFNQTAGKRHMTHCADQAKKNKFKK